MRPQTQTQTQTLPSLKLAFKLSVNGYVKIPSEIRDAYTYLMNPYKFKGWIKRIAKHAIAEFEGGYDRLPKSSNQVTRILEPLAGADVNYYVLALHPINQLFGAPARNRETLARALGNNNNLLDVYEQVINPARIGIIVDPGNAKVITSVVKQGQRDDINTVATAHPHDIVYAKITSPITVTVMVTPIPFDALRVPEFVPATSWCRGMRYADAYVKLLERVKDIMQNRLSGTPFHSPFGGRTFHSISIEFTEFKVTEVPVSMKPPVTEKDLVDLYNALKNAKTAQPRNRGFRW